jgi:hypothetical protein
MTHISIIRNDDKGRFVSVQGVWLDKKGFRGLEIYEHGIRLDNGIFIPMMFNTTYEVETISV